MQKTRVNNRDRSQWWSSGRGRLPNHAPTSHTTPRILLGHAFPRFPHHGVLHHRLLDHPNAVAALWADLMEECDRLARIQGRPIHPRDCCWIPVSDVMLVMLTADSTTYEH